MEKKWKSVKIELLTELIVLMLSIIKRSVYLKKFKNIRIYQNFLTISVLRAQFKIHNEWNISFSSPELRQPQIKFDCQERLYTDLKGAKMVS